MVGRVETGETRKEMLNTENKELCYQVLKKYGIESQMLMVIEECSELQKEICKIFRKPDKTINKNTLEELVDVIVMCEQLRLLACVPMDDINYMAKAKLERALKNGKNKAT